MSRISSPPIRACSSRLFAALHGERRFLSAEPVFSQGAEPRPAASARYDFHGVGIEIVDRSGACAAAIDRRLATFSSPNHRHPDLRFDYKWASERAEDAVSPPGSKGRPVYETDLGEVLYYADEDVLRASTHDGAVLHCECGAGIASVALAPRARPDAGWLGSRPFFTLPFVELMKRRGLFCVHAAGLVVRGRAVVIAGPSGSGKTTLTLALIRAGFGFLSDDMLFLRANSDVKLMSFPDELDVTEATAHMFPELGGLEGRPFDPGWSKHRVRAEEVLEHEVVHEALPGLVVVPERTPGHSSELTALEPDHALVDLAPNVLLTEPSAAQRHIDALSDLVRASDCYRLQVGDDLEKIPALLADAMGEDGR